MLRRGDLPQDVIGKLMLALAIEVAVLPPYLYACWSIRPRSEGGSTAAGEASRTIRSVMYEEMLHVATVANLINALGARPAVARSLIRYPGVLPGHVTTPPYAFTVGLLCLSGAAIDTFKRIEMPEWGAPQPGAGDDWITIGGFYDLIKAQLPQDAGAYKHGRQLPARDNPGPGYLRPICDRASALLAIDTIVTQGEGHRPKNPAQPSASDEDDASREVAHFYQFVAIGDYLAGTPPTTPPLIDPARDVYPVIDNPVASLYSLEQKRLNLAFNQQWSRMLDSLDATLASATPEAFGEPTRLMVELRQSAAALRNGGLVPGTTFVAGPTFEYLSA